MNKSNEIKIMLKNCPHREKQREKETDQNVESEVVFGVVCQVAFHKTRACETDAAERGRAERLG